MSSLADAAQPVERRNSQCRSEIPVRTASHCGFFQLPSDTLCQFRSLREELGNSLGALHRRPIHSTVPFQLAFSINGSQGPQLSVEAHPIAFAHHAYIYSCARLGGNDIRPGPALDETNVHRQAALAIGEFGNALDLPRQLENRAMAFVEVEARVSSFAGDLERILAHSFPGRLNGAFRTIGGLE